MQIRFTRLALICGLFASFFLQSANADTLKQIYDLAVANDPQIRAAEAQLKANLENRGLGRAGILPQISLSGDYSDQSVSEDGQPDIDRESTSYSANLNQALLDFPAWYSYKRGDALADQAEQDYLVAKQDLIVRVATAYFNVLRALDTMDATKAEEVALAKQLEQTKQRYDVGLIAVTDVHEAQAAYDDVRARLVDALGLVGISFENLTILTGQTHNNIAPLESDFPITAPTPEDPEEWVQMALQNSYTLKSAMLSRDASSYNAKSAKWQHAPSLSLGLRYTNDSLESSEFIGTDDTETTAIALSLEVPLYLGGSISASRRQAAYEHLANEENLNNTRLSLIQNTRNQHLTVRIDVAEVDARKQAITSSQSAYEATRAGYDVGTRNLVDVLNAEQAVYQARRDYYQARYDYIIDHLVLDQLVGDLTSSDIESISDWLDPAQAIPRNIVENSMPGMPLPGMPRPTISNKSSSTAPTNAQPAAQPAEVAEEPVSPPTVEESSAAEGSPQAMLAIWAQDWSQLDIDAYLDHYASNYAPRGESSDNWQARRRQRLQELDSVAVRLANIAVLEQSANRARVRFEQTYRSSNYADLSEKEVVLVREDGNWKIAEEKALTITRL